MAGMRGAVRAGRRWRWLRAGVGVVAALAGLGAASRLSAATAPDSVVEVSLGGEWTTDNIAVPPASQLATRMKTFEASWHAILYDNGGPVHLSDLKADLSKEGTFELFDKIRWISGEAHWTVSDIRPGSSCHARAARAPSFITIGRASKHHIYGDVQLGDLFVAPSQPCIAPDYVTSNQSKATWKPEIKDPPYGWDELAFRENNVVFPINISELERVRSVTIPVSYVYTYESASAVYDILDKWSGEVEIRLR